MGAEEGGGLTPVAVTTSDRKIVKRSREEAEEEKHYCKCGDRVHNPDDICGHGVADGRCCICDLCRKELQEGSKLEKEEEVKKVPYYYQTEFGAVKDLKDYLKAMKEEMKEDEEEEEEEDEEEDEVWCEVGEHMVDKTMHYSSREGLETFGDCCECVTEKEVMEVFEREEQMRDHAEKEEEEDDRIECTECSIKIDYDDCVHYLEDTYLCQVCGKDKDDICIECYERPCGCE